MKKLFLSGLLLFSFSTASAQVFIPPPPVIPQPQQIIVPGPVKTIQYQLTPNVIEVPLPVIKKDFWGRSYIVYEKQLITTWVWTPVEVWTNIQ